VTEKDTFSLPYPNSKRASYVDCRDVAKQRPSHSRVTGLIMEHLSFAPPEWWMG